jgi:molybdate transport system substrate-binding protein
MREPEKPEVRLIGAGGFKAALERLAKHFETTTGYPATIRIGTPAETRQLMGGGYRFDVAVVTGHTLTDAVADSIDSATRFSIAKSPVGMGVRADVEAPFITSEASLRDALQSVQTIALSDPAAGTLLANHVLKAAELLDLRSTIEGKAKYMNGPGFIVARRVASGEADSVITLATEIISAEGIRYLGALPDSMGLGTVFDATVAKSPLDGDAARAFHGFLKTSAASDLMRSTGLVVL